MKTLLLLRHAKSSWKDATLPDHDRPLNKRGRKAAPRMGRLMHETDLRPDCILCSTATRARETLQLVQGELGKSIPATFHAELYHCDVAQLLSVLREVAEPTVRVLVIGHNPDLELFLEQVTGQSERLSTGALARIELDLANWSELTDSTRGTLVSVTRPRELARD